MDIHICSNYLPREWWGEKTKFNTEAIYRRIDEVHWHYEFKKVRKFTSDPHAEVMGGRGFYAMDKFLNEKAKADYVPGGVLRQ